MLLDQAIFTSARTSRLSGYQLVAASCGARDAECRELAAWGPTHDSLYDFGGDPRSVNFQSLAGGRFAISLTTANDGEYSGRAGNRVYTQFLLASPADLADFANDPFALLAAAEARGALAVLDEFPAQLPVVELPPATLAPPVEALNRFVRTVGVERAVELLGVALASPVLGLALPWDPELVVRAIVLMLPPELRTQFTFSTGLVYSPRRPVRLSVLPAHDSGEHRRLARLAKAIVWRPDAPRSAGGAPRREDNAWTRAVRSALGVGRADAVAALLTVPPESAPPAFDGWAARLEALLERQVEETPREDFRDRAERDHPDDTRPALSAADVAALCEPDGAEGDLDEATAAIAAPPRAVPARPNHYPELPPGMAVRKELDGVLYAALAGEENALRRLPELWHTATECIADGELETLRETFVRRVLRAWRIASDPALPRDTRLATSALDVLCTLLG